MAEFVKEHLLQRVRPFIGRKITKRTVEAIDRALYTEPGERICRECGIDHIPTGEDPVMIGDTVLCWADDDLCSHCDDRLQAQMIKDAERYRYLRNRQTRAVDVADGGIFAGGVPHNVILGGEHLDRAIDAEMGADMPRIPPLEERLAECLAECIDTALITGRAEIGGFSSQQQLRLGFFLPDLSERAAELLEEAGR